MRMTASVSSACARVSLGAALLLLAAARDTPGQAVNADSIRGAQQTQVTRYRAQVADAARVFLDGSRTASDRLDAVRDLPSFLEQQQLAGGLRVALAANEPSAIRVRALQLLGDIDESALVARRIAAIALDAGAPGDVRAEAVRQLAARSFELEGKPPEIVAALRSGARDPDIEVRRTALRALAGHSDTVALRLLRAGLESPANAPLPPAEAVTLLGLANPSPHFDLFNRIMTQSPDSQARAAAVGLLGAHDRSRVQLVVILRNPREPSLVRHAALGALGAGDPANFAEYVLPVVADEAAPVELRLRGIAFLEMSRTSRDPGIFARAADDFDRLMVRLRDRSPSSRIRSAAQTYLARTRSAR
jgi:hypothetical protein